MNKFLEALSNFFSEFIIKAIVAVVLWFLVGVLYLGIFGDSAEMPMIVSVIVFVGIIWAANAIVNKFSNKKK